MKDKTYLVVVRTTLDELPILLTASAKAALGKAKEVTDAEIAESAKVMGVDCAGPVCTAVITFAGGKPTGIKIVKHLDAEPMPSAAVAAASR